MKASIPALFLALLLTLCSSVAGATEYYADVDESLLSGHYFVNETLLSIIFEDENGKVGFFDKESGFMQLPYYDEVFDFYCEDSRYPILVGLDHRYGYVDRSTGQVVIPLQYEGYTSCSEFHNGFALIAASVIHHDGSESNDFILIDTEGNQVVFPDGISPDGYVQDNGLLIVSSWSSDLSVLQFGLCNIKGDMILDPQYEWICAFQNGYASFRQDGKWGHIDEQGNVIVPPQFVLCEEDNHGYYFSEDGAATFKRIDGTYVAIDVNGNIVSSWLQ